MRTPLLFAVLLAAFAATTASAVDEPDVVALMNSSHQAYYYAGEGGSARVHMVLTDKKGRTREREFWMLRRDVEDMGDQRYFTYFLEPADVSRTAFLVHKHAEGNDDRWLYMPALDLVKRIAANDRGSSFMGSDFTYEDVSGRLPSLDHHERIGTDTALGRPAIQVRSTPKDPGTADYAARVSWIDEETHLPLREEYLDAGGQPLRIFEVRKIEMVDGFPTAVERSMTDARKGSHTEISFTDIAYHDRLAADDFSERMLKNPPREYTR